MEDTLQNKHFKRAGIFLRKKGNLWKAELRPAERATDPTAQPWYT